jgi:hypothetical protein
VGHDQPAGETAYRPQDQRNSDQNDVLHRHSPDGAEESQTKDLKRRVRRPANRQPAMLNLCRARLRAEDEQTASLVTGSYSAYDRMVPRGTARRRHLVSCDGGAVLSSRKPSAATDSLYRAIWSCSHRRIRAHVTLLDAEVSQFRVEILPVDVEHVGGFGLVASGRTSARVSLGRLPRIQRRGLVGG